MFPDKCSKLKNPFHWNEFRDTLYKKDWCPYIKETFNGFGNAIEYLGRYANRIAITNTRIKSVSSDKVIFSVKDYRSGQTCMTELKTDEFLRRLLMHVLPSGFQKIRYYGFLNNRNKKKNLSLIFKLQGHQKFHAQFVGKTVAQVLKMAWNYDISLCPCCKANTLVSAGRSYPLRI